MTSVSLVRGGPALGRVQADAHAQVVQRGVTERTRPPQRRALDRQGPLHLVGPGRQRLIGSVVERAEGRVHAHGACGVAVEGGAEHEHRPLRGRLATQHPEPADPHRPRFGEADVAPEATGVPVGVEAVPVLEHAGDVPLGGEVVRARAGDLDGEVVLASRPQRLGHLEGVRREVPLCVTQVRAVEPRVALVEDPVEGEPRPPSLGRPHRLERPSVEERAVDVRERRGGTPVAGHGHVLPPPVVEVVLLPGAAEVVVRDRCAPRAAELHQEVVVFPWRAAEIVHPWPATGVRVMS